jgi:predicted nucleotidyltransferase
LLDFSKKIELRILSALVKQVSAAVRTPYLLAGATARDLLLVYAHEIPNNRATVDVDFAFLMESWEEFETLRKKLLVGGDFVEVPRKGIHKLRFRRTLEVDILPFGGIERRDRSIVLPPDGAVMSMFGFREALGSSVTVLLPDDAMVAVVSLPALAILKLIAWSERRLREPGKDAYDLLLIIRNYADASGERIYDANPHVGSPSDYEAAGAWLLGKDMAQLLDQPGHERLARIIADEADAGGQLRLVGDMMQNDPERALELLGTLEDGFIGERDER